MVLRTTRFSPRSGLSHQPAFAKSLGNDLVHRPIPAAQAQNRTMHRGRSGLAIDLGAHPIPSKIICELQPHHRAPLRNPRGRHPWRK